MWLPGTVKPKSRYENKYKYYDRGEERGDHYYFVFL